MWVSLCDDKKKVNWWCLQTPVLPRKADFFLEWTRLLIWKKTSFLEKISSFWQLTFSWTSLKCAFFFDLPAFFFFPAADFFLFFLVVFFLAGFFFLVVFFFFFFFGFFFLVGFFFFVFFFLGLGPNFVRPSSVKQKFNLWV